MPGVGPSLRMVEKDKLLAHMSGGNGTAALDETEIGRALIGSSCFQCFICSHGVPVSAACPSHIGSDRFPFGF